MVNWLQQQAADLSTRTVDQLETFVRRGADFVVNGVQHIMEGMDELQLQNGQDMEQLTLENGQEDESCDLADQSTVWILPKKR